MVNCIGQRGEEVINPFLRGGIDDSERILHSFPRNIAPDQHPHLMPYEARVPNLYQYSSGWIVHKDTVSAFFAHTMSQAGFTAKEITDFVEFWGPRLTSDSLYEVYPQQELQIDKLIRLQVIPPPQNQLRLFFVRPAQVVRSDLAKPVLVRADRSGYHIAEWGVVMD
jgi:hypothetical protein